MDYFPYLLVAYSTYVIGTASPGPATLTIMEAGMRYGRGPALRLAAGVISGSLCWGLSAALGLMPLAALYPGLLQGLKILGGVYLLWLAFKSGRALFHELPPPSGIAGKGSAIDRYYWRGLALHLTNPQAFFAWIAIISLGTPANAPPYVRSLVVAGCGVLGVVVFSTYAIVFSTSNMIRLYAKARKPMAAGLAIFFCYAGFRLLLG